VLVTYAKPGEVVQPGQPLYKCGRRNGMVMCAPYHRAAARDR
jgi:hypothetical protein